jgi:glucose/arabinose dehydrogenase
MRKRVIFGAIALAAALVGCGSAGSSSPAATTTPTAAATAAATPTPDVRAIAAQQYLAAMTANNLALDAFNAAVKKLKSTAPWSAVLPAARTYYKADAAGTQAVFAIHFPPDMSADVSAVVSTFNSDQVKLLDFIGSPNQSTWDAWVNDAAASSASNAVRRDLGLPPVPLGTPAP